MSLYIRLLSSFWNHRKTARARAVLGDDALWIIPRLWSYAAENQPDGDFSKYSSGELAMLLGCDKHATSIRQALLDAGFMDEDGKLHDWQEHNGYHASFAERARKAANARWTGQDRIGNRKERKGKEASIASRMLEASPPLRARYRALHNVTSRDTAYAYASASASAAPVLDRGTGEDDAQWLQTMKDQFTWIDVDRELVKMRAWLTTPKGRGRKLTRRFIVAWLSKCDGRQVETPKQHRYDAMSV